MLIEIVPDQIWSAQAPVRFGPLRFSSRMTVVRLSDDRLFVHSPIQPDPQLRMALDQLGRVAFVVAPNKKHHLNFRDFCTAYPAAARFVAPGLEVKGIEAQPSCKLGKDQPWLPELSGYFAKGLPVLNETVFFDARSGTLIVTDLLFCFGPQQTRLMAGVAGLLGVHQRLAMSRTMKWMVKDRNALVECAEQLMSLPIERVITGHDTIVDCDARSQVAAAFAWLS